MLTIFLISENQQYNNIKFRCTHCGRYNSGSNKKVRGILIGLK